jgi:hypothetical protein
MADLAVKDVRETCNVKSSSWWPGLALCLFLALVGRSVISYAPYSIAWDELYFLHRAVCVDRAVYALSLTRIGECYGSLSKSPIMTFLTLPWGPLGAGEAGVGLALVTLGILTWLVILIVYTAAASLKASRIVLLLAGACIYLNPFLRGYAGGFLADALVAWAVAGSLLLVPLEAYGEGTRNGWQDALRGLMWAFLFGIGALSKVSFGFFLIVVAPLAIIYRWRRCGRRSALVTTGAALAGSLPAILVWLAFGRNFVGHAVQASFGGLAKFYAAAGSSERTYLREYFRASGYAVIPLAALLLYFLWSLHAQRRQLFARVVPVLMLAAFLILCGLSPNQDYRFSMPVMIALPILLAVAPHRAKGLTAPGRTTLALAVLAGSLLSFPMVARPDMSFVRYASDILERYGSPNTTILLATDHPYLNIETFLLAQQIGGERLRTVRLGTLVYDYVNNRPLAWSLDRTSKADIVLFHRPPLYPDPPWANQFASQFRDQAEKSGSLTESGKYLDVFRKNVPPAAPFHSGR